MMSQLKTAFSDAAKILWKADNSEHIGGVFREPGSDIEPVVGGPSVASGSDRTNRRHYADEGDFMSEGNATISCGQLPGP